MSLLLLIAFLWVVPISLTNDMARRRNRPNGWVWGLLLGWIGVCIVAVLPPVRDPELSALELAELRRKLNNSE
jgi:hypothetical protein